MARASQIYVVHPKGDSDSMLAVFTVKYESQLWAERHYSLHDVERYRIRDAGNFVDQPAKKFPCPWEEE